MRNSVNRGRKRHLIWLKFWLFRWYGPVFFITGIVVLAVAMNISPKPNWQVAGAGLGGVLLAAFTVQQRKLEELKLFTELFQSFNRRFERIAAKIRLAAPASEIEVGRHLKLKEYLDLCAEEYFYFDAGYIHPTVWQVWCVGIRGFIRELGAHTIADRLLGSGSDHYGLTWEVIEEWAKRGEAEKN